MNLHSGSGTSPVSFLQDDSLLTLRRSLSPPPERPLRRAVVPSLWLLEAPEDPCSQDSRAPEGSALHGGEETPVRGPKSSTCRARDEAGAVPSPPHHNSVLGALLPCEGRISCCNGSSSCGICWCCTSTSHLEAGSPALRTGRNIWCAAPEHQARGSCLTACCAKGRASAQNWKETLGTGSGLENLHPG